VPADLDSTVNFRVKNKMHLPGVKPIGWESSVYVGEVTIKMKDLIKRSRRSPASYSSLAAPSLSPWAAACCSSKMGAETQWSPPRTKAPTLLPPSQLLAPHPQCSDFPHLRPCELIVEIVGASHGKRRPTDLPYPEKCPLPRCPLARHFTWAVPGGRPRKRHTTT
jgi:hypothetical protein